MNNQNLVNQGTRLSRKGGRRPGGGRKKKVATLVKEKFLNEKEAVKSLEFIKSLRDDENQPSGVRFDAAKEILDRVWGKARQSVDVTANGINLVFSPAPGVLL